MTTTTTTTLRSYSLAEKFWTEETLGSMISPFIPRSRQGDRHLLSQCYEGNGRFLLGSVLSGSTASFGIDMDMLDVTDFARREPHKSVYITARRRSAFYGDMGMLQTLFLEGYALYPVEEYEHTHVCIKPLRNSKRIADLAQLRTGRFREDLQLSTEFDSSFAFMAMPADDPQPSNEMLDGFSNWLNGCCFSYELLCATRRDGQAGYQVDVMDNSPAFFTFDAARDQAEKALHAMAKAH